MLNGFVVRNYYDLPLCRCMVKICSTHDNQSLFGGHLKIDNFIAENLENIENHREEKYTLSINSTQRVTCPLYKDIKRIMLKIPEDNISLEKVAEFQVIYLQGERKRDAPFYLKK